MSKPTSSKPYLSCCHFILMSAFFFSPLVSIHYLVIPADSYLFLPNVFQFRLTSSLWEEKPLTKQRPQRRSTTFVTSEWKRNWSERARALVKRLLCRPRITPGTRFSFFRKYTGILCCLLSRPRPLLWNADTARFVQNSATYYFLSSRTKTNPNFSLIRRP